MNTNKVALVTGANRGLGLATARKLAQEGVQVILTSRDNASGQAAQAQLQGEGLNNVDFHQLDITSDASVKAAFSDVAQKYGKLDILINNAAIRPDVDQKSTALTVPLDTVVETMMTNTLAPLRMIQTFVPLLKQAASGAIINVSGTMGSLQKMTADNPATRLSKAALNAVTRMVADELKNTNIRVNSLCPLWVKTAMGGPNGKRTPEEAAVHVANLALLGDQAPHSQFLREGKNIDW